MVITAHNILIVMETFMYVLDNGTTGRLKTNNNSILNHVITHYKLLCTCITVLK